MFGNGFAAKADQCGEAVIYINPGKAAHSIMLTDVLYLPSAAASLISVTRNIDNGVSFAFNDESCIISQNKRCVATQRRQHGVYVLDTLNSGRAAVHGRVCKATASQHGSVAAAISQESLELWHRRFGHLCYDSLARVVQQGAASGISITAQQFKALAAGSCDSCIKAKQHRPSVASKTTRPLELLHMDVFGPLPDEDISTGGCKYLATFYDNSSIFSLVEPLRARAT
jgi:GAG-pre-integrase domain